MKKTIVCALVLSFIAGFGYSQALSRVWGKVVNSKGEPIPGVRILVTLPDSKDWKKEVAGDAKGNFEVSVTDGTKSYVFELAADGYISLKESVKPRIFTSIEKNFTLMTQDELAKQALEEEMKRNPHIRYFEDGKTALLAGNKAEARKQFEACLKEKPDYTKVLVILASLDEEEGKHDAAIEKAKKALEAKDQADLPAALKVLIRAYSGKGDKAKALDYQKQLDAAEPDSPESLFNKAVVFLNKKDDAGAKPLLEKAVEMNPEFADGLYELGFIYLREGETARSKDVFEKFLKLVPSGEKAETAKETIKWL